MEKFTTYVLYNFSAINLSCIIYLTIVYFLPWFEWDDNWVIFHFQGKLHNSKHAINKIRVKCK